MELSDTELEAVVGGKSRGSGGGGAVSNADAPTVAAAVTEGKSGRSCGPDGCKA